MPNTSSAPSFWNSNKTRLGISFASKLLVCSGISAFYYFNPIDPATEPDEFVVDNYLLIAAILVFLTYESYKLYKAYTGSVEAPPNTKTITSCFALNRKQFALGFTASALAISLFIFDPNMAMNNIVLVGGILALTLGALSLQSYRSYQQHQRENGDVINNLLACTQLPKNPETTKKLIANDLVLTGIIMGICLGNHPLSVEKLLDRWQVGLAAAAIFTAVIIATTVYYACTPSEQASESSNWTL